MKKIYVVSCCRTAIGAFGGSLKNIPATKLGAIVIREALNRAGMLPEHVDEVMFGCILSAGLGQNPARQASVEAGLPFEVPAYTVSMVCGSGMKSVIEGARAIQSGDAEIIVTGGMENMSSAPYIVPAARFGARMFNTQMIDTMVYDGLWDAFHNYHMGTTAENICEKYGISREELDEFSASSQAKTLAAQKAGKFNEEIVPVPIQVKKEIVEFQVDEFPRASTTVESLATLAGAFTRSDGSTGSLVTAGNASGINDGAAAIVLASGAAVERYHLNPIAELLSWGQGGVDPKIMGIGPVPAAKQAMKKANLTISDIDLIEANEAFAAQSIAVSRDLSFDLQKLNVNGGAISLGHPVGASGARIIVTLLHEMKKRNTVKKGLATLCIGGGMGVATIFETSF